MTCQVPVHGYQISFPFSLASLLLVLLTELNTTIQLSRCLLIEVIGMGRQGFFDK
ncbi:MAG: hypothetical protein ACFE9C_18445 [Candidatus Hodarchaeota archaeon]